MCAKAGSQVRKSEPWGAREVRSRGRLGYTDALERPLRQGDCTGGGYVVQATLLIE